MVSLRPDWREGLVVVARVNGDDALHISASDMLYCDLPGAAGLGDRETWCRQRHAESFLANSADVDCDECRVEFVAAILRRE